MKDVILLADPESKVWNFSKAIKKYIEETKEQEIQLSKVEIDLFRNKETKMHVPENVRTKDVYFIHDSSKNPSQWWTDMLLIKDLLNNASANSVSFVLPSMLWSRQDRKDKPHVPISARAVARSITPGTHRIITMDLHAAQIQGFYPETLPVDNLYSFPKIIRHLREKHASLLENLVIVSPDAGGVTRARSFSQRLYQTQPKDKNQNYPLAVISKIRAKPGEVEKMYLAGDVKDKDALIVDDILDSGGTLCKATDLLKENKAKKVYCYATHGIFTKGTEHLNEKIDKVFTSNLHYVEENGVEVIDLSGEFAEAIYRAQKGLSISKLFE